MRCAIAQPTFLPWLGWFDIFDQADEMVLLDTVQFSKQSWQQRNRIRTANGPLLISVPVQTRGRPKQSIQEVEIADKSFGVKFLRTLQMNYAKAPFFDSVFEQLSDELPPRFEEGRLSRLNEELIAIIARWLDITTPVRRASELPFSGGRGEYLSEICVGLGASEYLSTAGAREYLLEDLSHFTRRGVTVLMHDYQHPEYVQLGKPFLASASAIDLVMMYGPSSGDVMRSSSGTWTPLRSAGDDPTGI